MYGHARTITDHKPIPMIKVSVYRNDLSLIRHSYTNDEGRYDVEIPQGESVTVRFDTHYSLNNATDWHPSVVVNVIAGDDVSLDRYLLRNGQDADHASAMDALNGYLLAASCSDVKPDADYARTAEARLGMLKQHSQVLIEIQERLRQHFHEQA
ncbi:carboxypeptidase regulatory-like domain-containing protein [Streptomyces sp. NPDC050636]|uniref:carboxypeptidase-like regulatory domain-containing protein n=1 Tax=Streptomyces sp. NPDC050636 TaxID=3154510 RepID=UPI003448C4CA